MIEFGDKRTIVKCEGDIGITVGLPDEPSPGLITLHLVGIDPPGIAGTVEVHGNVKALELLAGLAKAAAVQLKDRLEQASA